MSRIFNFNAGPAALPLEVLEEVQAELLDFNNTGMSILEISHRSPAFEKVLEETKQDIKDLLNLPDDYGIFFMGGGGSLQFSCVPCNFLKEGMTAASGKSGQGGEGVQLQRPGLRPGAPSGRSEAARKLRVPAHYRQQYH